MPIVLGVPAAISPSVLQSWGRQLAEHRRSLNLTQPELAAKVGLHPQTISRLERGQGSADGLRDVAAAIGLTLSLSEDGQAADGPAVFRHLPTLKEAFRYDGDNGFDIGLWADGKAYVTNEGQLIVRSKQGEFVVTAGDYVVRGTEGEFYPCPAEIFIDNYEHVGNRS